MTHKLARLCWNDKDWRRPSGSTGKTRKVGAFEHETGFGHEEWLFDTSKVIDGYHYGYVQAVSRHRETNNPFDLSLYSIDNRTKQRWWLGKIRNVESVGAEESARVYELYEKFGWLDQMRSQVVEAGADLKVFEERITPDIFAVLKFRIENLCLCERPMEFEQGDPAVTSDYYNLKNFVQEPRFIAVLKKFQFKAGHNPPTDKTRLEYGEHQRDANNLHNHIQTKLYAELCKIYGDKKVGTENNTSAGSRVDLVVCDGPKYALYEIKTGPSLLGCVREAIGQLLEYRHTIGHNMVSRLVVVSPLSSNKKVEVYLASLREEYAIPIYYEQCKIQS
jgi:hypothetical protein